VGVGAKIRLNMGLSGGLPSGTIFDALSRLQGSGLGGSRAVGMLVV